MVNKTPKPYKYTLSWNDGVDDRTTVLVKDPMGWSEQNVSFMRSEDFGLDMEYVVPLSFTGDSYTILKSVFERTGAFSIVTLTIEKRNNKWQFNQFYRYRLNFNTYKDNFKTIKIEGIDDGLLSKISANADKEYEITIPATNKVFLEYQGVTLVKKNLIQCGYGKLDKKDDISEHAYLFKGARSLRNYTEYFQFTDESGLPFETMTIKCVKAVTTDIEYNFTCTIKASWFVAGDHGAGQIIVVKHDSNFDNPTTLATFNVDSGSADLILPFRTDSFVASGTLSSVSLVANDYISVFYLADTGSWTKIEIFEGSQCFISINSDSESSYNGALIEMFTFDWLIKELLLKIDSNATLSYMLPDIGYVPLLGCTQTIKNLNKTNGSGTFKAKLKDVLKALNYSYCTAYDIAGNTFTVYDREDVYNSGNKGELTTNNIVVEFDEKHCYNTIKVGGKTKDKYEHKTYPFNCLKTFKIPNTLSEKELDLENPFEIDCFSIEEMIQETVKSSNENNKDKTDFFVLACEKSVGGLVGEIEGEGYDDRLDTIGAMDTAIYQGYIDGIGTPASEFCVEFVAPLLSGFSLATGHTLEYYASESKKLFIGVVLNTNAVYDVNWDFRTHDGKNYNLLLVERQAFWNPPNPKYYRITIHIELYTVATQTYYLDLAAFLKARYSKEIVINSIGITVSSAESYSIYSDVTSITDFEGDETTIYNLPLSTKRALLKHLPYISISCNGSTDDIVFETSDRTSNPTVQLGYEVAAITENDDVEPVAPLFLPVKFTFTTQKEDDIINDLYNHKYGYYTITHEKSKKQVSGWVNKAIFAVSRRKQQTWELQAKTI